MIKESTVGNLTSDLDPHSTQHEAVKTGQSNVCLKPLLNGFQCHFLADQSRANLMDRVDTKFMLSLSELPVFLSALKDEYTILEQDRRRLFTYETTYYDTPDRLFYRSHHNGKLNRHKVRFRRYRDTHTAFMEVKLKNNKQRTIKKRMQLDAEKPDFSNTSVFLKDSLGEHVLHLERVLLVKYQRITLMNKKEAERLTLDLSLSFKSARTGSTLMNLPDIGLPQLCIAELKRNHKSKTSAFLRCIKERQIRPASFSKYCIGSALVDPGALKRNRFKATLKQINSLTEIKTM